MKRAAFHPCIKPEDRKAFRWATWRAFARLLRLIFSGPGGTILFGLAATLILLIGLSIYLP